MIELDHIIDVAEHRNAVHAVRFATRVPLKIISDWGTDLMYRKWEGGGASY